MHRELVVADLVISLYLSPEQPVEEAGAVPHDDVLRHPRQDFIPAPLAF